MPMNPFGHRVSEMSSTGITSGLLPVLVRVRRARDVAGTRPRRESVVVMVKNEKMRHDAKWEKRSVRRHSKTVSEWHYRMGKGKTK